MTEQDRKSLVTLEYGKVLESLAGFCVTEGAKKKALELEPCSDIKTAKERLDQTDDAANLIAYKGAPPVGAVQNPSGRLRRAEKGASLSMSELLEVGKILRCARLLSDYRDSGKEITERQRALFSGLYLNKTLERRIEESIVSSEEMSDRASPALSDIRRKIRNTAGKANEILNSMIRSQKTAKYLQDAIITMRQDRFVIPVKIEHKNDLPGIVHDVSGSGATIFVEPMAVVEANNEMRELYAKEKAEIERILAELSAACAEFADSIIEDYAVICELDFVFAKAKLSYGYKGIAASLNDRGKIKLLAARHPLIDPSSVVPIDVYAGDEFRTLIITGPNTGGKTVTLKTVGLFVLMSEAGLHIPAADGSEVSVFDHILADIGDEQSIEQSLSTFSAHMKNIVEIMQVADASSLVLFDELGAGTDPVEGAALAIAILEYVRGFGAVTLATTHYAELKAYGLRTDGVENGSCEFDVKSLRPTYRLLIGIPGRSNAFAISKRLGLSQEVIDRAKELVSEDSRKFERALDDIEKKRYEIEKASKKAFERRSQAVKLKQEIEKEREEIEKEKERELQKARNEAKKLISQARGAYETVMEELDQLRKKKAAADFADSLAKTKSALRRSIEQSEDAVYHSQQKEETDEVYRLPRPLKIGDFVMVPGFSRAGTVTALADSRGMLGVMCGAVKTKVGEKSVRLVEAEKKAKQARGARPSVAKREVRRELDLRGMLCDDAILELDCFISDGLLMGLTELRVIHGKGTGALRSAVGEYLGGCREVKSFRLGGFGEGDTGVTIVELK